LTPAQRQANREQINQMIYHRKVDGRFYFEDFKAMIQPSKLGRRDNVPPGGVKKPPPAASAVPGP